MKIEDIGIAALILCLVAIPLIIGGELKEKQK